MRLIAHRGFASVSPENTLEAVDSAAAVADEIEVDVRRCGSDDLVVVHDRTVDRVTDKIGAVSEYTRSELGAMSVLGTEEKIPTLPAVLRTVPDHVTVNAELKEPGIAAETIELLNSLHPNAIVSSFSAAILDTCRTVDPSISRAYITDEAGPAVVETATGLECECLNLSEAVCTESTIEEAHRVGLSVNAWTIDTKERAESLAETGIDGVIADRPSVLPDLRSDRPQTE